MRNKETRRIGRRNFLQATTLLTAASFWPRSTAAANQTLFFYNWDEYIGETTLTDFQRETGIKVRLHLFADSEEQFAKIRTGNAGYDITVPTHNFVERMVKAGLLLQLNNDLIPNKINLAKMHQNPPYDPHNQHSIPYMWGTMGIAYRKSTTRPPTSWSAVLTAQGLANNGRVAWISEASSMVAVASLMFGKSVNDHSSQNLESIFAEFNEAKSLVTKIAGDNGQDLLAAGEVNMAIEWNGDIAQLMMEDDDIGFVIPAEGSIYYVDCLAILADTANPEYAHEFLNFILRADVGSDIAEYIAYPTANQAAFELTSPTYRNNSVTFPPPDTKLEIVNYPGEKALRRLYQHWEAMLAA